MCARNSREIINDIRYFFFTRRNNKANHVSPTDKSKYRLVCWSLSERGAVGETILHLCMLNATSLHADLAKRLLRFYPNLINDIYISDEYYGESESARGRQNYYVTRTRAPEVSLTECYICINVFKVNRFIPPGELPFSSFSKSGKSSRLAYCTYLVYPAQCCNYLRKKYNYI